MSFEDLVKWRMLDTDMGFSQSEWNQFMENCRRDYLRWHPNQASPPLIPDRHGFLQRL